MSSFLVSSGWGESREEVGSRGTYGCPVGKQTRSAGPEIHGHGLCRRRQVEDQAEGRSRVIATWGLWG